eukprot:1317292-Amorphochlora_amoeboformis.AAC.2
MQDDRSRRRLQTEYTNLAAKEGPTSKGKEDTYRKRIRSVELGNPAMRDSAFCYAPIRPTLKTPVRSVVGVDLFDVRGELDQKNEMVIYPGTRNVLLPNVKSTHGDSFREICRSPNNPLQRRISRERPGRTLKIQTFASSKDVFCETTPSQDQRKQNTRDSKSVDLFGVKK